MATSISIDASIAVKAIVEEQFSDNARSILATYDLILAPAHAYAEIAEVVFRKFSAGQIEERQVVLALERLPSILTLVPLDTIIVDVFNIAKEIHHSVYDCLYVAAAMKHGTELVTTDVKLVLKTRNTPYSAFVRHLADSGGLP